MSEKEQYILNWIHEVSKTRKELQDFAICPFASKSKYKIIECSIEDLYIDNDYDVLIFVIESDLDLKTIEIWISYYNQLYSTWKFFEDCGSYDTFINGVQTNNGKYNLILGQPRKKLRKFRESLAKTDYYKMWSQEYLQKILEDDIDILN